MTACAPASEPTEDGAAEVEWNDLALESSLELQYADQFAVDYYTGGYALIHIGDGSEYIVVPEDAPVPDGLADTTVVLQQPLDRIYLVATSAMDLFSALDGVGNIRLSGTDEDGWYIEDAKGAMQSGAMLYAGKYNSPDYELIYAEQCDLAVESTRSNLARGQGQP